MNYTELVAAIENATENTFEVADMNRFIQQAEKFIYETMQLPVQRRNQSGVMSSNNRFLTLPDDFIYMFSLSVLTDSGRHRYLRDKDQNFILEAYPDPTVVGVPKYYAIYDENSLILGPTPGSAYGVHIHYGRYPESIVTASNTWLGDNFDNALFHTAMVGAFIFMRMPESTVMAARASRDEAIMLLKNLSDGKLRQDAYRTVQKRSEVI